MSQKKQLLTDTQKAERALDALRRLEREEQSVSHHALAARIAAVRQDLIADPTLAARLYDFLTVGIGR